MKVTDYIVQFLVDKGITDCFGYPGGVICHFIDSVSKNPKIKAHINYNEQGSAFAACGYAQASGIPGVAFSTSGPGATNLVTGIANAYFDSTPCFFFTGQVDTYACADGYPVRQRGFQETNIVSVVKDISKWAIRIDHSEEIRFCLEKAFYIATTGNPGPVVIDLPADVQRAEVDETRLNGFVPEDNPIVDYELLSSHIIEVIGKSTRPVIIAGNGIKQSGSVFAFRKLTKRLGIPIVSSLPAFDVLPFEDPLNFGFIGTNGHRYANFLLGKADLIISVGSRLDIRQIGLKRESFAVQAKLIRIDIDQNSLDYHVHDDEIDFRADVKLLIPELLKKVPCFCFSKWIGVCDVIKKTLRGYDDKEYNKLITSLTEAIPDEVDFSMDVGQHQLWFAQSSKVKVNQRVFMSSGHGSMGFSIPAAIGINTSSHRKTIAFCGDGGFMMNVQELQYINREKLPIKVICVNNASLGMIRGFQERNFSSNFQLTTEQSGYLSPDLKAIALAFGFDYYLIESNGDINRAIFDDNKPSIIELRICKETVLEPNFGRTGLIQDQMPYIDRDIYNKLMEL